MALETPKSGEDSRRNWKFIQANAQAIDALRSKTGQLQFLIESLRKRNPMSGVGGWRFANPIEYDREASYAENEIVIVSPENQAVTEGASLGASGSHGIYKGVDGYPNPDDAEIEDIALAGMWVCLRDPKVLSASQPADLTVPRNYDIHVPTWPLPGPVDGANNYWQLVGFLPVARVWCDPETGAPENFFVQAVKIPEPPPAPTP